MKQHPAIRALLALGAFCALVASIMPPGASAQATGIISQPFSLASTGLGPTLSLSGQSTCSITVYNGASFSLTAQTASDGPQYPQVWNTATNIGTSGVVTGTGTYGGNIAGTGAGNTNFRFVATALGTGPLTGVESCTPATSGGVSSVTATSPIVASTTAGTTTISAPSAVVLSPGPAQTGNINVTGFVSGSGGGLAPTFGGIGVGNPGSDTTAGLSWATTATGTYRGTLLGSNSTAVANGVSGVAFFMEQPGVALYLTGDFAGDLGLVGALHAAAATINGAITQPAYAQHGVASITTPATCTALSACVSLAVTLSPALTTATYECTANTETYPYVVEVATKTTTAVTFELYNLVAVATAQTVPVDYDCKV